MGLIKRLVFPIIMVAGLLLSSFVIVNSLRAATLPAESSAVSPVKAQVAPDAAVAHGQRLFIAKGCIVCHGHDNLASVYVREFDFGNVPNLTKLRVNEEYLMTWLKDPQAIKPGTEMPNLELKKDEIDALIAFLTSGSQ